MNQYQLYARQFLVKLFSLYSIYNELKTCSPVFWKGLPAFRKLPSKLNIKKLFKFQQSTYKTVKKHFTLKLLQRSKGSIYLIFLFKHLYFLMCSNSWLYNHIGKIRGCQDFILINSCTESSFSMCASRLHGSPHYAIFEFKLKIIDIFTRFFESHYFCKRPHLLG